MHPMALLILLAFGSLVATCFAVWLLVTFHSRAELAERLAEARSEPSAHRLSLSNDVVRGARAPRKHPPVDQPSVDRAPLPKANDAPARPAGDPFERFLDPRRDRDRF